jgi:hypothetical protein
MFKLRLFALFASLQAIFASPVGAQLQNNFDASALVQFADCDNDGSTQPRGRIHSDLM